MMTPLAQSAPLPTTSRSFRDRCSSKFELTPVRVPGLELHDVTVLELVGGAPGADRFIGGGTALNLLVPYNR